MQTPKQGQMELVTPISRSRTASSLLRLVPDSGSDLLFTLGHPLSEAVAQENVRL